MSGTERNLAMSQYTAAPTADTPEEEGFERDWYSEVPNAVIKALMEGDITHAQLAVYVALLTFRRNEDWQAWPSLEALGKRAHTSRHTTIDALKRLCALRLIKRVRNDAHKSATYAICMTRRTPLHTSRNDLVEGGATTAPQTSTSAMTAPVTVQPLHPQQCNDCTQTISNRTISNELYPVSAVQKFNGEGWSEDEQYMQLLSVYPKADNPKKGYPQFKRHRSQFALMLAAAQKVQDGVKHGDDVKYVPDISRWLEEERWLAPGARSSEDYAREARREAEEQSKRDRFDALCASVISAMERGYTVPDALKACSVPVELQGQVLNRVKGSSAYKVAVKRETSDVSAPEDTTGKLAANGKRYHFAGNVRKLEKLEESGETPQL